MELAELRKKRGIGRQRQRGGLQYGALHRRIVSRHSAAAGKPRAQDLSSGNQHDIEFDLRIALEVRRLDDMPPHVILDERLVFVQQRLL